MNVQTYSEMFDQILATSHTDAPYNDVHFLDYTKLNASRFSRWMKKGELLPEAKTIFESIQEPLNFIIITEHWCGDAAHVVPFIVQLAALNENITVDIELRDSEPFRIEQYLTNGGKSIPKLIVKNAEGEDVFVWGPRPEACQIVFNELKAKNAPFEEAKIALQNWYNTDKGVQIQQEISNGLAVALKEKEAVH